MRKVVLLAVMTALVLCVVTEDVSACRRRRSHGCYCEHPMRGVRILSCSCTSAAGTISWPDTKLVECYVIDANGTRFDGVVAYPAPGAWQATFPAGAVSPCTCYITGDAGSNASMICQGYCSPRHRR
jgi:hypothetical protein